MVKFCFCCLCGRGRPVEDVVTNSTSLYIDFEGGRKEVPRESVICYECIEKYFGKKVKKPDEDNSKRRFGTC